MFGPNYAAASAEQFEKLPGLVIVFKLVGAGEFNDTVIGIRSFCMEAGQLQVDWTLVAIPHNLLSHHGDLMNSRGKIYKNLRREVDKVVSWLIKSAMADPT